MSKGYEGMTNADRMALLDSLWFSRFGGVDDDSGPEQATSLDIWESDSSGPENHFGKGLHLAGVDRPQDNKVTYDFTPQLDPSPFGHLSECDPEEKRLLQITLEDFELEQGFAVELLTRHIRNSYMANAKPRARIAAIDWIFANVVKEDEVDFTTCCTALGVRDYVLKARIHYEFYLRWIVYPSFPFLTLPMPEEILSEIQFKCGFEGSDVARHAWYYPGVELTTVIEREERNYDADSVHLIVDHLVRHGFLSRRVNNLYLTGRNPAREDGIQVIERHQKNARVIWSRLW